MENAIYVNYNGCIEISIDALIVAAWNRYIEYAGGDNFISINYAAAIPVALGGRWDWRDRFVYFDEKGYLSSFSHWDDERSPIDLDKIDISSLIDGLQDLQTNAVDKKRPVNNIPKAIHEALQE